MKEREEEREREEGEREGEKEKLPPYPLRHHEGKVTQELIPLIYLQGLLPLFFLFTFYFFIFCPPDCF